MTRTELIDDLANRSGMDKKDVKSFLEQLTSLVEDEIKRGGEVSTAVFTVSAAASPSH